MMTTIVCIIIASAVTAWALFGAIEEAGEQ